MPKPSTCPTSNNARERGKQLILASKAFTKEQPLESWFALLSTITAYACTLTFTVLPVYWPVRILASGFAGLVMVRLFVLYHDHQHGTILRGSRIASLLMWLYGVATFNPPSIWNRSHNHHHRNTAKILGADIGSFPVMTTEAYAKATRAQRCLYHVARHPLTMALGYVTIFMYGMCIRSLFIKPREHWDSAVSLVLHGVILTAVGYFWGPSVLLLAVIVPSTIAAALGAYLFYAQHNYPGVILQSRADWDYTTAALKSSSYTRMNALMRWATGNIGYHHVHHLNHHIPFYRLPEAMAALPELQSPGTTSLSPRDILRCLRLKLWDTQTESLITFKEARELNALEAAAPQTATIAAATN